MIIDVTTDDGTPISFECEQTIASAWVSRGILEGSTYPHLPFVGDVQVVLDAGANCGAAAVYFAHHYPDAVIHCCEPGSLQRAILERNAADRSNIVVHPIGLHDHDGVLPLYQGLDDSGMTSLHRTDWNAAEPAESVTVRAAGPWAAEMGLDRLDVVKLDVEGCEVPVLESLGPLLPTVKVLYVEYDSRHDRRAIDRILADTHDLYAGKVLLDQGELVYVSRTIADDPAATEHLRERLTQSTGGR